MSFNVMDFMSAAHAVGVGDPATFAVAPDVMAKRLLDAAKRHARFLEDHFSSVGHREMLEHVAKSAGFSNWHAFQTLTTDILERYTPGQYGVRPTEPGSLFEPFVPALPLLIRVAPDLSPNSEQLAGMQSITQRLSDSLGSALAVKNVLAKLNGSDTWALLLARKPENSTKPLYEFCFDGDHGVFWWTPACAALVEQMDRLWQRYSDRPSSEKKRARRYIENIVAKRPDFLEGWLALATIEELDGRDEIVGSIYEAAIQKADALIPSEFKGTVSWLDIENRFFHRLLYGYMRWNIRHAQFVTATKLARRQLKLNPEDNLGVRIDLPLLFAVVGKTSSSIAAMRKLTRPDAILDGHVLLIMSLCHLLNGDTQKGQRLFLNALFELPALRPLLSEQRIPDMHDADWRWHRGVIPDFDTLWFHFETAIIWRPDALVEPMLTRILRHPEVEKAELQSASLFDRTKTARKDENTPRLTMGTWKKQNQDLALDLVGRFGVQWLTDY